MSGNCLKLTPQMSWKIIYFIFFIHLLSNNCLKGQVVGINRGKYNYHIKQTTGSFTIDGDLSEEGWSQSDMTEHFHRILPTDTGFAKAQTEVRLIYTKSHLYMGI